MNENLSYLDRIRINEGNEKCGQAFISFCVGNRYKAVEFINDPYLSFPCLYMLLPAVKSYNLYNSMNYRNKNAVQIINYILKIEKSDLPDNYLSILDNNAYKTLKWMFETGNLEDVTDELYDNIIDIAVSVLLDTYKDTSILPAVVDIIFKRNAKGRLIHNLVWAAFKLKDPFVIKLIAERLCSQDKNEVEFAASLVNVNSSSGIDNKILYNSYSEWLKDNDPYLYFTDESFQYKSNPAFCAVDIERKYLNKGIESYEKQPLTSLNENEASHLEVFKSMSDKEKELLSEYSLNMRKKSLSKWQNWMDNTIDVQLNMANLEPEEYN